MRTTQSLTITLPYGMLEIVRAKVASGEYATESEVIRDGLRALLAREVVLERWLREEVVKSYDECEVDASLGVSASDIMDRVRTQYRQQTILK